MSRLTNLTDEDVQNVIQRNMSPMNVSVHAVSPDVRRRMMGRNAQRGMDVLEAIMAAGRDSRADRVVPRHERRRGAGKTPALLRGTRADYQLGHRAASALPNTRTVLAGPIAQARASARDHRHDQALPDRAYERFGRHTFQMSDEFYLDAGIDPPEADFYDGYPQYYDGIGMIRSYLDETDDVLCRRRRASGSASALASPSATSAFCASPAPARATPWRALWSRRMVSAAPSAIKNRYFGGNVDVTGLIVACDILEQLPQDLSGLCSLCLSSCSTLTA